MAHRGKSLLVLLSAVVDRVLESSQLKDQLCCQCQLLIRQQLALSDFLDKMSCTEMTWIIIITVE